jgi:hypothetical protein
VNKRRPTPREPTGTELRTQSRPAQFSAAFGFSSIGKIEICKLGFIQRFPNGCCPLNARDKGL